MAMMLAVAPVVVFVLWGIFWTGFALGNHCGYEAGARDIRKWYWYANRSEPSEN